MRRSASLPVLLVLVILAASACGDELSLPPATFENRVDTVTLYAVNGTPIHRPSAYSVSARTTVRTDFTSSFDFLYYIDANGRGLFLPQGLLSGATTAAGQPGLQRSLTPFDDIAVAEQVGYVTRDTVEAEVGQSYYLRSAVTGSCFLGTPFYGKLQILEVSESARAIRFQVLTNINCGYRSLEEGLPER